MSAAVYALIYNLFSAADFLGMFSMFGRTRAPTKRAPQEKRQIFACRK